MEANSCGGHGQPQARHSSTARPPLVRARLRLPATGPTRPPTTLAFTPSAPSCGCHRQRKHCSSQFCPDLLP
eukprot:6105637-Alexandrium_andersonii.AAC.1